MLGLGSFRAGSHIGPLGHTSGMPDQVERADALFLAALAQLQSEYRQETFWVERDVVYWLQRRLRALAPEGMTVWNDYGILPGPRRALSADLVLAAGERVLLAAEFKYEPAAGRRDIKANKLPVIGWADELKDIERIAQFVAAGAAPVAWAVCIDEGGRYRDRPRPSHSTVRDWDTGYGTQVTFTRSPVSASHPGVTLPE